MGPTSGCIRSSGHRPEAWTFTCSSPRTTLKEASITSRFGYTPRANAKKSEPSASDPLKKNRS